MCAEGSNAVTGALIACSQVHHGSNAETINCVGAAP
jgi:hypothetical protein